MRKIFVFVLVVATLVSFSACQKYYTHGVYEVTIKAKEISNDYVGSDWKKVYTCDGRTIVSGEQWTVPLETAKTVTIDATITEKDEWDDVGSGSVDVILTDGYQNSTTITVTENKGRYKGNKAQWEIFCKVELVEKLEQE